MIPASGSNLSGAFDPYLRALIAAGRQRQSKSATVPSHLWLVRLPAGTLQVHWPEGNVLIPSGPLHREPGSQVPDYNAVVTLTKEEHGPNEIRRPVLDDN